MDWIRKGIKDRLMIDFKAFLTALIKVAPYDNHLSCCVHKCYVPNAVFAFAFTPSPLKLIKCNN